MADDTAEHRRLQEDRQRLANWKRWGTYLPERQWGTVREDYSADGACWEYLPHDHARSRAYRWGEDGIFGITDRQCRLCLAPALWNGVDPILKERLYGLTGNEGNHGEDAKECWWHIDATPTASYAHGRYRYPLDGFPYGELLAENRRRGKDQPEYELEDTGAVDDGRFADLDVIWAKAAPEDLCGQLILTSHCDRERVVHLLPQAWFRNTWSWGCRSEGCGIKPWLQVQADGSLLLVHEDLGRMRLTIETGADLVAPMRWLTTENTTNFVRLFGQPNVSPYVKDGIERAVIHGESTAVHPKGVGSKAACWLQIRLPARGRAEVRWRLRPEAAAPPAETIAAVAELRRTEADLFHRAVTPETAPQAASAARRAYAGLLWSRKFYHYIVHDWLTGDPDQPVPPAARLQGRNREWGHLYNRDIISLPDPWEYPWYASWDLAFHAVPLARVDPDSAKQQLELFLREWYMHPNGQIPAYEFALGDVNPPVHAWAAWRVYRMEAAAGRRDLDFLERVFHKLLLNFTWWVNRKDKEGNNLFAGGFLGLDNIGLFDRSKPPPGADLHQADGTAWMAFYAGRMLTIALELARHRPVYEDIASKFLEHFVAIADAMNGAGGAGLWDEQDGFYYDQLTLHDGTRLPLRVRSLVGAVPLFASVVIPADALTMLPGFAKRLRWFRTYRDDLAGGISFCETGGLGGSGHLLLAIPSPARLRRVLVRLLDTAEFLSPFGIRSLSKAHAEPYVLTTEAGEWRIAYAPGESDSGLFGGNSNWRGPVWFPLNALLIEALERFDGVLGKGFTVEYPLGSGRQLRLSEVAGDLQRRLGSLFLPGPGGVPPCLGDDPRLSTPAWRDSLLFHEYFHGDTGRGLGASHQTGWTALAAIFLTGGRMRQSSSVDSPRR
ncbi:glucosidase [Planctomycetota bacterium]|nr:glucosidase [Planctomycetota bacterium]